MLCILLLKYAAYFLYAIPTRMYPVLVCIAIMHSTLDVPVGDCSEGVVLSMVSTQYVLPIV